MEKKICASLFLTVFITLTGIVHGQPENASRKPSVEPMMEVDIETSKEGETPNAGYDFAKNDAAEAPIAKTRVPANIATKEQSSSATNYLGPIIFLITLPIALWIMVSKKFTSSDTPEKAVDYFPKTQQFKPFKTDYQKSAEDDDDMDLPKAS